MYEDLRVLAIVPARGGDDDVPYLNIKKLGPIPLIAHTLREANKSRYIDRLVVSTDDDEVARVAVEYGADAPFRRPSELARDIPQIKPVIAHALRSMETIDSQTYDIVVTLQVTSPFRDSKQIDRAIEALARGEYDSVISVREVRALTWRQNGDTLEPLFDKAGRRENLDPIYDEDGAIRVFRRAIVSSAARLGERIGYVKMDKMSSLTVRDIYDFWLAEKLVRLPRVLFRVDGGGTMGMGHVFRSLAVASAIRAVSNSDLCFLMDAEFVEGSQQVVDAGYAVRLLPHGTREDCASVLEAVRDYSPNIIINDRPFLETEYLRALASLGASTINLVDSLADIEDPKAIASVIVATIQEDEADLENYYGGPAFAILRESFRDKAAERLVRSSADKLEVVLSFGGSDPLGITVRALGAMEPLMEEFDRLQVHVVIGPAFGYSSELSALIKRLRFEPRIHRRVERMADVLIEGDVVLCSGGMTVFEIAALGRPGLVLCQNMKEQTRMQRFAQHGSVVHLGLGTEVTVSEIEDQTRQLLRDDKRRREMSEAGFRLVDAEGARRVAEVLMRAERKGPTAGDRNQ